MKEISITKLAVIVVSIILIMSLALGYALSEQVANNDGFSLDMKVKITSIKNVNKSGGFSSDSSSTIEQALVGKIKTIFHDTGTATYEIVVENQGDIPVKLSTLENRTNGEDPTNVMMSITGVNAGSILNPGEKVTLSADITCNKAATFTKEHEFKLNYVPYVVENKKMRAASASAADDYDTRIANIKNRATALNQEIDDNNPLNLYPVGSVYMSVSSTNPGTLFGGTWEAYSKGRILLSQNSSGNTGGSETSTLTSSNIPAHTHDYSASTLDSLSGGALQGEVKDFAVQESGVATTSTGVFKSSVSGSAIGYGKAKAGLKDSVSFSSTHSHTFSGSTVAAGATNPTAINIRNPYYTVYMWKRVS